MDLRSMDYHNFDPAPSLSTMSIDLCSQAQTLWPASPTRKARSSAGSSAGTPLSHSQPSCTQRVCDVELFLSTSPVLSQTGQGPTTQATMIAQVSSAPTTIQAVLLGCQPL